VRGQAAEALGNIFFWEGGGPAVEPLIAALGDSSSEVRFWSAFALGQIRARQALPILGQLAATDDAIVPGWWSVKMEAADAVTTIRYGPMNEWPEGAADEGAAT
jgi:HEAT repeat protein